MTKPKIYLAEIKNLHHEITIRHNSSLHLEEPQDEACWPSEIGVLITGNEAKQIAQALEALLKLISALQKVQSDWAGTDNVTDPESSGYETLKLVDEALKPFTTKTEQP